MASELMEKTTLVYSDIQAVVYWDICKRIRYLFPKAHAASSALIAWRLAYYKVYFPKEYEQALRTEEGFLC